MFENLTVARHGSGRNTSLLCRSNKGTLEDQFLRQTTSMGA